MNNCNETNSKEYKVYLMPDKELNRLKKVKKQKKEKVLTLKYG